MTAPCRVEVPPGEDGQRVDAFLAAATGLSRNRIAGLIDAGHVRGSTGPLTRSSHRVRAGEHFAVHVPDAAPLDTVAEDLPLAVVHEDEALIVIDKPAGMVVHPAPGHSRGTLVNALLHHCTDLAGIGGTLRPGIVHRIDKDTSGLLVVSKNDACHAHLQEQFRAHSVDRTYRALCARTHGAGIPEEGILFDTGHRRHPTDRKRFTGQHGGPRRAITHVHALERFTEGALLIEARLETGRTHQIRVHLSEHGCPLLGDPLYGGRAAASTPLIERLALHATTLGFIHPDGTRHHYHSPLPADFERALERLREGIPWRR